MISEFRKAKLFHIFYKYFDSDSSGSINKSDFENAGEAIANLQGWGKDDPKAKKSREALLKVWDKLQSQADTDGDGEVTSEEWLNMWEEYAKNPSAPLEWQSLYCKFVFDLHDESGDGVVDGEEVSKVLQGFGFPKENAVTAFQKMSKGKPTISWEDFQELWTEFFTSEDRNDAGNFIFGDVAY